MIDLTVPEISTATGTWSVLAVVHTSDGALILGEQYDRDPDSFTLRYVVAFVPLVSASGDYASEWSNGRYFDHDSTRRNREAACAHFLSRVSDSLWS